MAGRSAGGTARASKKLLALYSLIVCRPAPKGIRRRASSIWCGTAPAGVGSSRVYCHKSQKTHVNGHSLPVRKTVHDGITSPFARRSSSATTSSGRQASRAVLAGRAARIRTVGVDRSRVTAPRVCGTARRSGSGKTPPDETAGWRRPQRVPHPPGIASWERSASSVRGPTRCRAAQSLP